MSRSFYVFFRDHEEEVNFVEAIKRVNLPLPWQKQQGKLVELPAKKIIMCGCTIMDFIEKSEERKDVNDPIILSQYWWGYEIKEAKNQGVLYDIWQHRAYYEAIDGNCLFWDDELKELCLKRVEEMKSSWQNCDVKMS